MGMDNGNRAAANAGARRADGTHSHVFLGTGHEQNERKTWGVIGLCGVMMVVEIVGGTLFGSLALVADGLHMSTHAGAMLIAALAYTYARRHAEDRRFVFGTGKLGDLAGFSSAIVLAMIALLIGYEAVSRFLSPVPIHFREAIPIAVVGLIVNVVSAWLLSGDQHAPGHHHGHGHTQGQSHGAAHAHEHVHDDAPQRLLTATGFAELSIFEQDLPPRFRLHFSGRSAVQGGRAPGVETIRPDGTRQSFRLENRGDYWESTKEIPEPHAFKALVTLADGRHELVFTEHAHENNEQDGPAVAALRDNSIRSAYIHVLADAVVSVLAISGLVLARVFGWVWMDPLAGIVGALVIANWAYGLLRDTGGILLDMSPDPAMAERLRRIIESDGDQLVDLHLWRLGPGHLGAVVSVITTKSRDAAFYRTALGRFKALSHVTVEVLSAAA
jgi:cation diffusion facilitator family transporter